MTKNRYGLVQIAKILKAHDTGATCVDLCRRHGMSRTAFYSWKENYGGMTVAGAKRIASLEVQNEKLKRKVADMRRDGEAYKATLAEKVTTSAAKRKVVKHLISKFGISKRRACSVTGANRQMIEYVSRREPLTELRERLRELARRFPRYGYRRLTKALREEGDSSGITRIRRLCAEEGLMIRRPDPRRRGRPRKSRG